METDLARKIGGSARAARKSLALTQAEVAEKADLATEVYGRLERGGMLPSLPTLFRLAKALHVPVATLVGEAPQPIHRNPERPPAFRRIVALLEGADARALRRAVVVLKAVLR